MKNYLMEKTLEVLENLCESMEKIIFFKLEALRRPQNFGLDQFASARLCTVTDLRNFSQERIS